MKTMSMEKVVSLIEGRRGDRAFELVCQGKLNKDAAKYVLDNYDRYDYSVSLRDLKNLFNIYDSFEDFLNSKFALVLLDGGGLGILSPVIIEAAPPIDVLREKLETSKITDKSIVMLYSIFLSGNNFNTEKLFSKELIEKYTSYYSIFETLLSGSWGASENREKDLRTIYEKAYFISKNNIQELLNSVPLSVAFEILSTRLYTKKSKYNYDLGMKEFEICLEVFEEYGVMINNYDSVFSLFLHQKSYQKDSEHILSKKKRDIYDRYISKLVGDKPISSQLATFMLPYERDESKRNSLFLRAVALSEGSYPFYRFNMEHSYLKMEVTSFMEEYSMENYRDITSILIKGKMTTADEVINFMNRLGMSKFPDLSSNGYLARAVNLKNFSDEEFEKLEPYIQSWSRFSLIFENRVVPYRFFIKYSNKRIGDCLSWYVYEKINNNEIDIEKILSLLYLFNKEVSAYQIGSLVEDILIHAGRSNSNISLEDVASIFKFVSSTGRRELFSLGRVGREQKSKPTIQSILKYL